MKKTFMILSAVVLMAGFSNSVLAEEATSAKVTGTFAGAQLVVPMTLTAVGDFNFGAVNILSGTATVGGTVKLSAIGAVRDFTGEGVLESSAKPFATNPVYTVTGTKNASYVITLPADISVKETLGDATMLITNFTTSFDGETEAIATGAGLIDTLDGSGNGGFTLGGTLNVLANQAPGVYTGTFDVTVNYN